jgi:DNA-binding MarR family transcriptional regulator
LKIQLFSWILGFVKDKPKLDNLRSSVWRLFLTTHSKLLEHNEAKLAQAELPPLEWYDVLFTLKEAPEQRLRLSELAEKVLLSRSNLSHLMDRLEKVGLLRRESCPSDRRGTFAVLTKEGLAMQERMWAVYAESITETFACHLDDDEVKTLQHVLNRLMAAADEAQERSKTQN